jgi:hypothetical protein
MSNDALQPIGAVPFSGRYGMAISRAAGMHQDEALSVIRP